MIWRGLVVLCFLLQIWLNDSHSDQIQQLRTNYLTHRLILEDWVSALEKELNDVKSSVADRSDALPSDSFLQRTLP